MTFFSFESIGFIIIGLIFCVGFGLALYGEQRKRESIIPQLQENREICHYHLMDLMNYCLGNFEFKYGYISNTSKCSIVENGKDCGGPCKYLVVPIIRNPIQ